MKITLRNTSHNEAAIRSAVRTHNEAVILSGARSAQSKDPRICLSRTKYEAVILSERSESKDPDEVGPAKTDRPFLPQTTPLPLSVLKSPLRAAALLAILLASATTALAQTAPLTMQQAVDLARSKNPTLLAAEQNLLSVKAQELQAATRQNPYLALNGSNLTEAEYFNNPYGLTLGVGRIFERGNKREWRLDSARSTTVETDAQLQLTVQQTILAVRTAFTNLIIAKAAKNLAGDNLADFKKEVAIGNDRYKTGDLAKLDFERLDLQLAQFESDDSNAITAMQQASLQLQVLLGIDKPTPGFDVIGDVVPPPVTLSMNDLEQIALAARPDLKGAAADIVP
jgi:cobalt-zinc-cadmium efflux system outer membrane protein